jgi:integrase
VAWIRKLESGLWAATVRTPAGRITESFPLKGQSQKWAADLEADARRGDFIDPRRAELTIGAWWDEVNGARRLEKASRKRDESHWRVHVAPVWSKVRLDGVLQPNVSKWINKMEAAGVGAATIQGAVGVLRALLDLAVADRRLRYNPSRGVNLPERNAHHDRVLAPDEDELLLSALDRQFPGRPDARLFVELLLYCGLRWEEAAALDREHVDTRRQLINVGPVMERDGTIRPYPKSPAGVRAVPVDDEVWPRLREHAMSCTPGGLLVTGKRGRTKEDPVRGLHYSSWLRRVWQRGLVEVTERGSRGKILATRTTLEDPQPTPHDMRHTYGTRLGEAGVPVHEIMALMGHETLESAQRYLHAGEDRFKRARDAVKARRGARVPAQGAGESPVSHEGDAPRKLGATVTNLSRRSDAV